MMQYKQFRMEFFCFFFFKEQKPVSFWKTQETFFSNPKKQVGCFFKTRVFPNPA